MTATWISVPEWAEMAGIVTIGWSAYWDHATSAIKNFPTAKPLREGNVALPLAPAGEMYGEGR